MQTPMVDDASREVKFPQDMIMSLQAKLIEKEDEMEVERVRRFLAVGQLDELCRGSSVREEDQAASAAVRSSDRLRTHNINMPTRSAEGHTNVFTQGQASSPMQRGAEVHGIAQAGTSSRVVGPVQIGADRSNESRQNRIRFFHLSSFNLGNTIIMKVQGVRCATRPVSRRRRSPS